MTFILFNNYFIIVYLYADYNTCKSMFIIFFLTEKSIHEYRYLRSSRKKGIECNQ